MTTLIVPKEDLETLEKVLASAMRIMPTDPDYGAKLKVITTLLAQVSLHRVMTKDGEAVVR